MLIATDKLRDEFKQARANLRRAISEKPERPSVLRMPRSISVHGDRTPSRGIRQAADLMNLAPPIRDPRLNPDNIYIPYSDSASGIVNPVLNEWYTYYYKHHPLVGNAIELHSQLPISRFGLTGVDDPQIMQVYEQMVDDLDLITNAYNYLKCWWLFGEVMPYCWWSEGYNRFVQMTFIETSRVRVMGHYLCFSEIGDLTQRYELEPDKMLQDLVRANDPFSRELVDYLDPEIVMSVRRGMNLELDPFSTELMANKALAWDLRGTSILQGVLKDLVHYDTLRNAQRAVADGHIAPKWIWKLGQPGPDGYMPTDGDLQAFRELLMAANQDPNFNIITHYAVSVEVIGSAGKILPIAQELDGVDSRILTRLFTNKALTHGEGPSYANASVALRALMSRYIPVRDSFEQYMDHKIFMPVALANNFIDKDGYPITPGINWRHKQALLDDASIRSMLLQMRERGDMPLKVLADGLDLDYDELLKWLDAEQGTIADRAMVKAKDTLLTKMLQQAEKGLAGIAEAFRQLRLPKNKEEGELLDKGKDVPEGYDPDENKQLSTDTEKKPPAVTPTPAPAPKSPTEKPQAPLGGESGEKVVQSYRRQRNHRRATKPVDFHPMRAQGYPISFVDGFSLNEWQERLRLTTIDKNSQQEIVAAEVNILNSFTNATDEFVSILLNVWRQKGSIGLQEVEHAVRDVIEGVNNESANGLRNSLTNLFNGAQEAAVDKLRRSKRGRRYLKKRGQTEDERRRNMNDALDQAFGKITTVSSEVIDRMRSILRDQPAGISQDIVQSLFAEFNAAELAGLSEAEIGERLGELWNRMRYVYERIIRTETVNMYNRAGLQEWADAGYTQVIRREINDNRTCAYCRTVDGLTFDINKLLKLDYPLIQDPDTGEYVGHPNCRGHFEPIVSFTDWDSFLPPPEVAFDTVESIEVGDTAVRGVPVPMADQIESALGVNDIQTNVDIVPDVVDTPVWIEQERERIRQEEVDRGRRPPSDMQLDLMVNESRENQRGQIALFESPEGELSISGFSFFADEPDWFVLRARGKQAHDALTKEQHTAVDELYRIKVKESTYTIDDDGIEIIGQPVGGRIVGFITPIASQDAYNYFIESFAFYQSDPYKLEFLDPVMYEFLRDFVHAGSEFKL